MGSEEFYLSRVEEPRFFRAQDDIPEGAVCCECERPIKEGQVISEEHEGVFVHEECVTP